MSGKANARGAANAAAQWDEKRLQDGLNHLQLLHTKLVYLRSGLSDVVSTVSVPGSSVPDAVNNIKNTAASVDKQVTELKALMMSDQTKAVFEHAVASQSKNPVGIKPWNPMDHPGYYLQTPEQ